MKVEIEHLAAKEADTISEWFAITDKVFKFAGWLLALGVIYSLYDKTKNTAILVVWMILCFFIGKLIAKIFLFRVHVRIGESWQSKRFRWVAENVVYILFNVPIFYACALLSQYIISIFNAAKGG